MVEKTKETLHQKVLKILNDALTFDSALNYTEDKILRVFNEQLEHIGLLGGVAILEQSNTLVFATTPKSGSNNSRYSRSIVERLPASMSISLEKAIPFHQSISMGKAVFSEDVSKLERYILSNNSPLVAKAEKVPDDFSMITCPLVIKGEICGAVYVAGIDLMREDIPLIELLSNNISGSLTNARLMRELREEQFDFRELFYDLPIGIYRVDKGGKIVMSNPALLNIFGVKNLSEIDEKKLSSISLRPNHNREELLSRLMASGKIVGEETSWQTRDGEEIFLRENITASFTKEGALQYYEGSLENISGRILTEKRLKQQLDEMLILNQVATAGTSSISVDDFLEQVTDIVSNNLFSDHFGVILWDKSTKRLTVHPSYRGLDPVFFKKEFEAGEGVVGKVFELAHPVRISDVREFNGYISSDESLRSELCVPIITNGQVLGVLNAERAVLDGFSNDDEILLTIIASQLATVLERARFVDEVEQKANQLTLLNQATLTTSRILKPDELIQLIAKQIINLFNPDSFLLALFDDTSEEIEIAIAVDYGEIDKEKSGIRVPFSQGGLTTLLRDTGQVLQIDDLEHSPLLVGYKQFNSEMRGSWLGIPLVSGNKILGALTVQYYEIKKFESEQTQFLESLAAHVSIAINNGHLFNEIQTRYKLNNQLAKLSEDLNRPQTINQVIETIGKSSISLVEADMAAVYLRTGNQATCPWFHELSKDYIQAVIQGLDSIPGKQLLNSQSPILIPDTDALPDDEVIRKLAKAEGIGSIALWPIVYEERTIAAIGCYSREPYTYTEDQKEVMMAFARQAALSLENARLMEAERSRRMEAEALYKTTLALTSSLDIDRVLSNILVELYRVIDYHAASLHLQEGDMVRIVAAEGLLIEPSKIIGNEYSANSALFQEMQKTMHPVLIGDAQIDVRYQGMDNLRDVHGWLGVPLVVGEKMIGCLTIDSDQIDAFNETHATQAVAFANQAAIAIETARLFSQTQGRLQILQSIHMIDQAISGNLDLRITLEVFLEQALKLLGVETIKVYAYDSDAQIYDLLSQRDIVANRPKTNNQFYDPERVLEAVTQRVIVIDLDSEKTQKLSGTASFSYFVSPLITKGQIRGVLEVFGNGSKTINDEWLDILRTLSTQAAIAIENADLITSLQKSNDELVAAYDRTLEGWAYALELRDRETIGHARRVTELTVKLARLMGIKGTDLANIRRGTLLHDIGKMGLPDSVLLKEGPLNDKEIKLMQTHPQLAYDMLSPIPYLKPVLDIPYYHHEKWNGTGYPHGMKGEEIPLAARIFAVVDVWDALIYDRPYRGAWDKNTALEYIKSESGKHFDPRVVQKFLELIKI